MTAAPFLSVVVPALNEEGCIGSFIERMRDELSRLVPSWEIVVVDDGSHDRTASIVAAEAARDGRVRLISGPHQGKGAALRQGLLSATGDWRFMADADLAMPPDNLARFLAAIEGPDPPQIVIGSREAPGSERIGESAARHVIGRVFNWTVQLLALPGVHDTQCGFKLFSRAAVETLVPRLTVAGFAMDVELLFLARRAGLAVREVGIIWHGRDDSRVAFGRGAEAFLDIVRMRWRHLPPETAVPRAWVVVAALAAALFALGWRFLTFSGFSNDHYVHLARAQQMVFGEWPVRDFVDPGMPLMYAASAVTRLVWGRALGAEFALVAGALALGAALMVAAGSRLSGSVGVGLLVSVLGVLIYPRSYGYPKVLLYAMLGMLVCRASAGASTRRILALAILTMMAFLFRHDHGLFVAVGAGVFILARSLPSGGLAAARRLGVFAALVVLLLAPWAAFVEAYEGLIPYFASAMAFSREEARANVLRELPGLNWNDITSASNAVSVLFYLFHLLPLVCLGVLLRRRRMREAWPGETSAIVAISVMAIPLNLSFLRDSLPARVPDAFVPAGLLGAWLIGLAFNGRWTRVRVAGAAVAVAVAAVSTAAVIQAAGVAEQMNRAELFTEGEVSERVEELRTRLARAVPDGDHIPSRQASALMPFMSFLQRCTARSDRLLVTSLRPEIYVIANRGFAGGHVGFSPGFYGSDAEQSLTLARLRRQSVPFVVRVLEVDGELAETMPLVFAYLDEHYELLAELDVADKPDIRLYLERGRRAVSTDQQTGWPCLPAKQPLTTQDSTP